MNHHPKPTWYKVAEFFWPDRCREIPEARAPERIVLRQFALVKRYAYLQQFASYEDPRYMHSHQWRRTFALGLRGSYIEYRIAGPDIVRRAPYFYTMDASVVHHVQYPTPDHLSIFVGVGRDDDLKHYYGVPRTVNDENAGKNGFDPFTVRRRWEHHILKMVKRI